MRKILLSVVLATTLALTSCQFDDSALWSKLDEYGQSIKDHEQRISALEELCKQMNTNIEAIQTLVDALEKRDYVTNVSEVRSNGEVVGYTISFAYSDTITIYHGEDGKDGANGADGKDGYTPQIGVMKDTDNIYYWTLDGEWLLDGKGNKIQANGVNGTDGTNGVTPQLKIENDYWYVSYDNGATWVQLGKATGEDGKDGQDGNDGADGSDGADGEDGDSIFKSVTQDDECVYFNLADGTMITLPKHDKENIQFEDLQVKAICCKNWDTNNDGELSYAEAAAVTDIGTVFKGNTNIIAFTELKYFTGITEIPESAFRDCAALWKIVLPPTITHIRVSSFCNCKFLQSVTIPNSVTSIGASAFYCCLNLKSVTLSNRIKIIEQGLFLECSSLSSIIIPDGVSSIETNAFANCYALEHVIIPDSVVEIGQSAFAACYKLNDLIMGNGVTKIGVQAFYDCSNLISVTIPNSIKEIEEGAFADCVNLKSVYCKETIPPSIGQHVFYYYHTATSPVGWRKIGCKIHVPATSIDAYKTTWSDYASSIVGYNFQ